jgi:hypothetical protein
MKNKFWFSVVLIALGSFLEVYYYAFRFMQDGIEIWLGVTIGIALTVLLQLTVIIREIKYIKILTFALIAYSVLCTSAGQTFSLQQETVQQAQEQVREINRNEEKADIEKRIADIDSRLIDIRNQKNQTVRTLEDRFEWKNTLAKIEQIEADLNAERGSLATRLSELREQITSNVQIQVETSNIYIFYEQLTGIPKDWLKFILHTILSLFIAIMAPTGIIGITSGENKKEQQAEEPKEELTLVKKQPYSWGASVSKWIEINWQSLKTDLFADQGEPNKILSPGVFKKIIASKNERFPINKYFIILNAAEKAKVIEKGVIQVRDQVQAYAMILKQLERQG